MFDQIVQWFGVKRAWGKAGCLAAMCISGAAGAAPMGFRDSWMLMTDAGPSWREAWVNHALTSRDAVGAGALHMRSDDGERRRTLAELTYTRLLARWNLPDAQANVWLFAGAGSIRGNDFAGSRVALAPGVQVDYETTRVYFAGTARLYRARGLNHDFASVRAGSRSSKPITTKSSPGSSSRPGACATCPTRPRSRRCCGSSTSASSSKPASTISARPASTSCTRSERRFR